VQVRIANLRVLVLCVHGVDGLGELGAAAFIDAARIDPDVAITITESMPAAVLQFRVALLRVCEAAVHVGEGDFVVRPSVGQDGVGRDG
jgi:hypothetical protein